VFNLFKSANQLPSYDQHYRSLDTAFFASDPHNPDSEALVTQAIHCHRSGQVKFRGSWWTARSTEAKTISPDEVVYVLGRHNLLLHVQSTGWAIPSDEATESTISTSESQFTPAEPSSLLQISMQYDHN